MNAIVRYDGGDGIHQFVIPYGGSDLLADAAAYDSAHGTSYESILRRSKIIDITDKDTKSRIDGKMTMNANVKKGIDPVLKAQLRMTAKQLGKAVPDHEEPDGDEAPGAIGDGDADDSGKGIPNAKLKACNGKLPKKVVKAEEPDGQLWVAVTSSDKYPIEFPSEPMSLSDAIQEARMRWDSEDRDRRHDHVEVVPYGADDVAHRDVAWSDGVMLKRLNKAEMPDANSQQNDVQGAAPSKKALPADANDQEDDIQGGKVDSAADELPADANDQEDDIQAKAAAYKRSMHKGVRKGAVKKDWDDDMQPSKELEIRQEWDSFNLSNIRNSYQSFGAAIDIYIDSLANFSGQLATLKVLFENSGDHPTVGSLRNAIVLASNMIVNNRNSEARREFERAVNDLFMAVNDTRLDDSLELSSRKSVSKASIATRGSVQYDGRETYQQNPMVRECLDKTFAQMKEADLVRSLNKRLDKMQATRGSLAPVNPMARKL